MYKSRLRISVQKTLSAFNILTVTKFQHGIEWGVKPRTDTD